MRSQPSLRRQSSCSLTQRLISVSLQNLYEIGKQVEEPSEEEVGNAISTFRASL
jgi:hypothetical protein